MDRPVERSEDIREMVRRPVTEGKATRMKSNLACGLVINSANRACVTRSAGELAPCGGRYLPSVLNIYPMKLSGVQLARAMVSPGPTTRIISDADLVDAAKPRGTYQQVRIGSLAELPRLSLEVPNVVMADNEAM